MSYASDALLRTTVQKVAQLEKKLSDMELKLKALENLTIPRPQLHARPREDRLTR